MKDLPHGPLLVGWLFVFSALAWAEGQLLEPLLATLIGAALFYAWYWVWGRRPRFLRRTLWDSVYMDDDAPLPEPRRARSLVCRHPRFRTYVRVDSRPGPGWMSDNYTGEACAVCGRILKERRTY